MKNALLLKKDLNRIDGKSYKLYKDLELLY